MLPQQRLQQAFDVRDPPLDLGQLRPDAPGRGFPGRHASGVKSGRQVPVGLLPGLQPGQDPLLLGQQLLRLLLSSRQLGGELIARSAPG